MVVCVCVYVCALTNSDLASKDIPFKDRVTQKFVSICKFLGLGKNTLKDFFYAYVFFPIYATIQMHLHYLNIQTGIAQDRSKQCFSILVLKMD